MANQAITTPPPVRQGNTPPSRPTFMSGKNIWLTRIAKSPTTPIAVALVISCIVMSVLSSKFFTAANVTNIVTQSAIVGIAAVGATFVIITAGIDLSVGSTIALSGMIGATLVHNGVDGFLGVIITIAVASLVGAFNGFSITFLRLAPFIVTLAVLGMGRGLTLQLSQGQSVYGLPPSLTWIGSGSLFGLQLPAVLTIVVFVAGHIILTRTTLGHKIFAVGGAVDHHGVPVTGEAQQLGELGSGRVPARGLVGEDPVQDLAFKLAFLVLVEGADARIPDSLSSHQCLQTRRPVSLSSRAFPEERQDGRAGNGK